jgi:hypothetical protein
MKELLIICNQLNKFHEVESKNQLSRLQTLTNSGKDVFIFYNDYIPIKAGMNAPYIKNYQMLGSDNGERFMNCFLKGFIKNYSSIVLVNNLTIQL